MTMKIMVKRLTRVFFASTLALSIAISAGWTGLSEANQNLRALDNSATPSSESYSIYQNPSYGQNENIQLRGRISTIPKGTALLVKLDEPVSSYSTQLGQSITGTLENDLYVNDVVAIPAGSEVIGQVANVSRSGRLGKHGEIEVKFHSVKTPTGNIIPIRGFVVTSDESGVLRGNSYGMDIVKGVGIAAGSTGMGAVTGVALGGLLGVAGTGAVMGTGVGALAGLGYAVARKGKDVVIPSGARLSVRVDDDITYNN